MFLVTVTLRSTPHQIVLGFEKKDTMLEMQRQHDEQQGSATIIVTDDYGQQAVWRKDDLASLLATDLTKHAEFLIDHAITKLRAEARFTRLVGEDPTTSFLVGGVKLDWGKK